MLATSSRRRPGSTVPQVSDSICGFTDLACPEPAVRRVQSIPACAGMTIVPVRAKFDSTSEVETYLCAVGRIDRIML
jgi:hypothetical protein